MKPNYQPWQVNIDDFPEKENLKSQVMFVLHYAILAPSTHNSQPWLFKLNESECEIYYDPKLILSGADPNTRDLHISIGCCIENLILAAKYFNIFESIVYGPFNIKEQLAIVRFKKYTGEKNNTYRKMVDTIPKRINARGIFSSEPVPVNILDNISLEIKGYLIDGININLVMEKNKILSLARLTSEGLMDAYKNPSFRREMSSWMNNSLTAKNEGIPGYALKMPLVLSFVLPTIVKWYNLGNFLARKNYLSIGSAPLIVVITVENENPKIWLKVGQLAERLFLEFNSYGWQTSIFVAAIEMGHDKEVQKIINTNAKPQFLFVVGRVDSLHKPTPRYSVSKKIILN